jgi:hypothetical protein
MHSYHKALPRVAAILVFVALASAVVPRDSMGLPQPQSPIIPTQPQSPIIPPTSAAYLPLVVREGTAHPAHALYLPLTIRKEVLPTITPNHSENGYYLSATRLARQSRTANGR